MGRNCTVNVALLALNFYQMVSISIHILCIAFVSLFCI